MASIAERELTWMGAVELARLIHGKEVSVAEVVEARQAGRELRTRDRVERAAVETDAGSVGLPLGVQVVARPWREDVSLRSCGNCKWLFAGDRTTPHVLRCDALADYVSRELVAVNRPGREDAGQFGA